MRHLTLVIFLSASIIIWLPTSQVNCANSTNAPRLYLAVVQDFDEEVGVLSSMPECSNKAEIKEIGDTATINRLIQGLARLDSVANLDTSTSLLRMVTDIYPDADLAEITDEGRMFGWLLRRANFDGEPPEDYILHISMDGSDAPYSEYVIVRSSGKITCQKMWGEYNGISNLWYRARERNLEDGNEFCKAVGIAVPPWSFEGTPDLNQDGRHELIEFESFWPGYIEPFSRRSYSGFPMPYYWNGSCFTCDDARRSQYFQLLLDNSFFIDLFDVLALELRIKQEEW
jgi:hypothetical protein